jgi:hypothetical protein
MISDGNPPGRLYSSRRLEMSAPSSNKITKEKRKRVRSQPRTFGEKKRNSGSGFQDAKFKGGKWDALIYLLSILKK